MMKKNDNKDLSQVKLTPNFPSSSSTFKLQDNDKITELLNEIPKRTNLLSAFQLNEIYRPLTLAEEEQMAHELFQNIVKQEKEKDDRYKLPEHLEEFRRYLDPPSKVKKKLPIISSLSPRTKAKIAVLPKPNDFELQEIRKLEKMTKKAGAQSLYEEIIGDNKLLTRPSTMTASRGGSRPVTSALAPISRASSPPDVTGPNMKNTALPRPLSPSLPTSLKLNLLLDDDSVEKKLPSLVIPTSPSSPKSSSQRPAVPISKLVPHTNVEVQVIDQSTSFFKQAEALRQRKKKQEEIVVRLLGKDDDDEECMKYEEDNKDQQKGWSQSEKGLPMPLSKPLRNQRGEMIQSRSSTRLNFSKLGSNLLSQTTSLLSSSNPYQPLPISLQQSKRKDIDLEQRYLNNFSAKVYDEIGVNLDPLYNRMRRYRQSLKTLFFYTYLLHARSAMKQWHEVTLYYRRIGMEKARWTIISYLRRVKYRRQQERKKHFLSLQIDQEKQRLLKNQLFMKAKAQILFRALFQYWKRSKIRKLLRERRSTVSIQKGVRGFIARRRVQKKIAFLNFLKANATKIQCMYRIHLAKRKVHVTRKMKFIHDYIEELNNKRLLHENRFQQLGAVSRLVQSYRVYNLKKRLFNMLYWLKYAKAIVIQKHIRGYLIRKKHANFRYERMQRQKLEDRSATIIQKHIRRYLAESLFIELLEEKEQKKQQHYQNKLFYMALHEQSFLQRCKRTFLHIYRRLKPFRYIILNKKAIIIQKIYRGYHGRQRFKMVRVYSHLQAFYKRRNILNKSCTKIQKIWRGYSARKKMKQRLRHRMAIKLQCAVRKFIAYRKFWKIKQLHEAARRLTRYIRRLIVKRRFHIRYEREQVLGSVVGFIQNFFRRIRAIRLRQAKTIELRRHYEENIRSQASLIHLLARIQLKILTETIRKPINKRYYTVSREDCVCFGPLQAMFVILLCGQTQKSRMELGTITLNQIDNSRLLKFLMRLPFFLIPKNKKEAAHDFILSFNGIYHPDHLTSQKKEEGYLRYRGLVDILEKQRKKIDYSAPKYQQVSAIAPLSALRALVPSPNRLPSPKSPTQAFKLVKQKSTLRSQKSSRNLLAGPQSSSAGKKNLNEESTSAGTVRSSALLTALVTGDLSLPSIKHLLSTTEFDILYTKSKNENNTGNKISYEEFCKCVEFLTEIHYNSNDININQQHHSINSSVPSTVSNTVNNTEDNTVASASAVEEQLDDPTEANTEKNRTISADSTDLTETVLAFSTSEGPGTGMQLEKFLSQETDRLNRKSNFLNATSLTLMNPSEALLGCEGQNMNYLLVMTLRLLFFFREDPTVRSLLQWLEKEAYDRLAVFVVKIQSIVRYRLAQAIVRKRKQQKVYEDHLRHRITQIVRIQCLIRRFLVRCSIRERIRETIVKYVPHLDRPYYYNRKTGVKSFTRPKVLGKGDSSGGDEDDVYSIAVPEPGLENIVNCYQCRFRQAVIFCQQCEDSMCMTCYQSLHYKGAKSRHNYHKIPKCSYCTYQVATKSCVSCVTHPPRPHSIQASKSTFSRGLYCDTCFLHEHDEYTQQLEKSAEKRQQVKRLLQTTMTSQHPDVSLLTKYLFQKIVTSHYFEPLTMNCEECNVLSASWRCYACQQIYCHRCVIYLHSMNPIFAATHHLEPISYYTAKMHKSLQKDLNQMYFVKKWEICLAKERQRTMRIEYQKAIILQSWWRMIYYGRKGRKYMKKQRLRQRKWWRLRQKENQEVRSKFSYRFQNIFGYAPILSSDTTEEKVLKTLPAWSRQRAREFIWRNMADWGHFNQTVVQGKGKKKVVKKLRKGIPKKGFDVGDITELLEQAKFLGDRLPGRILVRTAENKFETTCDLTSLVRPGEIIRIKRFLFGVVSVESDSIRLNRLWRVSKRKLGKKDEDDESEEESEEDDEYDEEGRVKGEVGYRMPTYANEKDQLYYRFHFFLYDLTIGNPVAQMSFYLYKQYCLRMMTFSLYMMRMNKRSKLYDESYQWKLAAVRYADGARWISAYFNTREALIDLSKVVLTEELKKKRFGDKKSSKREKRKRRKRFDDDEDDDDEDESEEEEEEKGEDDPLLSEKSMKYGKGSRRNRLFQNSSLRSGRAQKKSSTIVPSDRDVDGDEEDERLEEGNEEEQHESADEERKKKEKEKKEKIKKARRDSVLNMFENLGMRSNRLGIVKSVAPPTLQKKDDESTDGKKRKLDVENVTIAKKNIKNPKFKSGLVDKKPEKPWFATKEQEMARREREEKMSTAELALEADDWKEMIDPMTENVYYLNIYTNEMLTTVPRAITAKKQLEFENSKNKKSYDDAKRRIDHLELVTKKRLLISGYRKK